MPSSPYAQTADWNGGTPGTPRLTRAVLWLLALNVGVYFVQQTVQQNLPDYLGFGGLGKLLEGEWWTLVTYMFVHGGFLHLAFNMYALWMFGPRLEEAWGTRAFTWYYLWCGLGGVVAHMAFVRGGAGLVGASGAIFGLLLAFAVRWPDEEILFFGLVPMKMKWFALFLGAINLVSGAVDVATGGGGVSHLAHLGGFVFGALWLARPAVPNVEHLRRRVSPAPDVSDGLPRAVPPRGTPRPRERGSAADEAVERSRALTTPPPLPTIVPPAPPAPPRAPRPARAAERGAASPPGAAPPSGPAGPAEGRPAAAALVASTAAARREVLDRLLDKISADGIASLTGEERRLLEETSRSLRDQ
jgi:membrane associated rhomboid family serine protease